MWVPVFAAGTTLWVEFAQHTRTRPLNVPFQ